MSKQQKPQATIELIRDIHKQRLEEIQSRLGEFDEIRKSGTDLKLWEEMVFCFFTGGCSAKMGLRSLEAVKGHLASGDFETIMNSLVGKHRYPRARARYVIESRTFLEAHCSMQIRKELEAFDDNFARRDWLVQEKGIKGLGYKEASHYLRNIGFKGYAILDKHVLRCLEELEVIDDPKPPTTRKKYLGIEEKFKSFANELGIDFDEMDFVLWSMKTGEILK